MRSRRMEDTGQEMAVAQVLSCSFTVVGVQKLVWLWMLWAEATQVDGLHQCTPMVFSHGSSSEAWRKLPSGT